MRRGIYVTIHACMPVCKCAYVYLCMCECLCAYGMYEVFLYECIIWDLGGHGNVPVIMSFEYLIMFFNNWIMSFDYWIMSYK